MARYDHFPTNELKNSSRKTNDANARRTDRFFFVLLSLCCLAGAVISPPAFSQISYYIEPPGELIDIDGRRMHIHCIGDKSPSIILDSGLGGFSLEWSNIQRALSQHVRVCAYDRAGYGWSEESTHPRSTRKIVHELRSLLRHADIRGPYVIVGHSFGGFTAQYFARQFNNEVAGIMLLDSSHEQQIERFPKRELPESKEQAPRFPENIRVRKRTMVRVALHENFPRESLSQAYALMHQAVSLRAWRGELNNYPLSSRQLREVSHRPFPDVPLVVVSRGQRVWPQDSYGNAMEVSWRQLQGELGRLNDNATHIIAKNSGHSIHMDEPELVVEAILRMLSEIKYRVAIIGG